MYRTYVLAVAMFLALAPATQGDIGVGVKIGIENLGFEVLGPRWFGESLCLVGSVAFEAKDRRTLLRESIPPFERQVTQSISSASAKLGILWYPLPKRTVRPYVGAGPGISFRKWEVREQIANMVDMELVSQSRESDRERAWTAWGTVGLEWAIVPRNFLIVEAQYEYPADFHEKEVGGLTFFAGLRWRF